TLADGRPWKAIPRRASFGTLPPNLLEAFRLDRCDANVRRGCSPIRSVRDGAHLSDKAVCELRSGFRPTDARRELAPVRKGQTIARRRRRLSECRPCAPGGMRR